MELRRQVVARDAEIMRLRESEDRAKGLELEERNTVYVQEIQRLKTMLQVLCTPARCG